MIKSLIICAISFWFEFLGVASAAVVVSVDTNNMVTGIEGLSIGELGTYDVDFLNGTYDSIWGSGFDFNGKNDAIAAIDAVRDTLNNEDIIAPTPAGVDIHTGDGNLQFYIPYDDSISGFIVQAFLLSTCSDGYGGYVWYYNEGQN